MYLICNVLFHIINTLIIYIIKGLIIWQVYKETIKDI